MNGAFIRFAMVIGAMFHASAVSAQAWDILTPQLNAIEFGRQNAQTINDGSESTPDFAADDLGDSLMSGLASPTSQRATRAARSVDTSYQYSPARSQQNLRSMLSRTPDPAARAELQQMFAAQPTLMDDIAAGVRAYGFDPHNVADAYAVWWMNAWLVANKRDEVPDSGTIAMVKQQVYAAFAATPDFANTSDAERQEYAEALLLQATMLGSAFEQFKNDPKMLDQLSEAARKGAKAQGIDLSLMTLTAKGFGPRKGK
jgi:hypothetical protein